MDERDSAARIAARLRQHRVTAASLAVSDPIGSEIHSAKADLISQSLREEGYDEDGKPVGRA